MLFKQYCRGVDAFTKGAAYCGVMVMLLACFICAGNAFSRYFLHYSSNLFLEMQWYCFGVTFMLSGAHVLSLNEHVRVDILYHLLPSRARLWWDLLGLCFFLIPVCLVGGYLTWDFFLESWRVWEFSENGSGLLRWPAKILFPIGFSLLFLQALSEIFKTVAALWGGAEHAHKYEKPQQ